MIVEKPASWAELKAALSDSKDDLLFRGQANEEWPLLPKLARHFLRAGIRRDEWREREQLGYGHFQLQARALGGNLPDDEDLISWLALMRHHGAPTRLLDWTASFYVATYFAYSQMAPDATVDAALWSAPIYRQKQIGHSSLAYIDPMGTYRVDHTDKGREVTTYGSTVNPHRARNKRVVELIGDEEADFLFFAAEKGCERVNTQQGFFSCCGQLDLDIAELPPRPIWVPSIDGKFSVEPLVSATKYILPPAWRKEVLTDLWRMNINEATLFPGTDGLARSIEAVVELDIATHLFYLLN